MAESEVLNIQATSTWQALEDSAPEWATLVRRATGDAGAVVDTAQQVTITFRLNVTRVGEVHAA